MPLTFFQPSQVDSTFNGYLRNRIINGAMQIDQRNAGASVTPTGTGYILDRYGAFLSQSSKFSVQQNGGGVTPPAGFSYYMGITSLSSYSIGASEIFGVAQCIEAFNINDLAWGTASAKTCVLSFWVRSSLTGQFGGFLKNGGIITGGAYNNYYYPYSYTINSANTWEYKTVVITPPTSGSWETGNGPGVTIAWSLGAGSSVTGGSGWSGTFYNQPTGSTNLVATNGATLYITGVQFEVGAVATPFERRQYSTELMLCQRYYFKNEAYDACGAFWSTGDAFLTEKLPTTMRAAPTITFPAGPYTSAVDQIGVGGRTPTSFTSFLPTTNQLSFYVSGMTGATLGNPARLQIGGVQASAEL